MRTAKFLIAGLFVVVLFIGSGQVVREAYLWLTRPAIEPDRSKGVPLLENNDIVHSLRIATAPFGASAVWLVCSGDATIRMVLNTRLPIEETFLRNGRYDNIRVQVSRSDADQPGTLATTDNLDFHNASLRRDDVGDVVVTPPLAPDALALFLRSPVAQRRDRIRISLMETGTNLRWNADVAAGTFVERCNAGR